MKLNKVRNLIKEQLRMLMMSGVSLGAPSSHVHSSMMQYVSGYSNGVSVIDLLTSYRNMFKVIQIVRTLMLRKHTIIIVANTADHARMASSVFVGIPNNVNVLTTRWLPGMFSNYNRFRNIVKVFRRMSDDNKTRFIHANYDSMYKPVEALYTKSKLPRLVIFIDMVDMEIARKETSNMGIPTVGFVNTDYNDTNSLLTYKVPIGASVEASAIIMLMLRKAIMRPLRRVRGLNRSKGLNKRINKRVNKRFSIKRYRYKRIMKVRKLKRIMRKLRLVGKFIILRDIGLLKRRRILKLEMIKKKYGKKKQSV